MIERTAKLREIRTSLVQRVRQLVSFKGDEYVLKSSAMFSELLKSHLAEKDGVVKMAEKDGVVKQRSHVV